jgi:hypothetical protein
MLQDTISESEARSLTLEYRKNQSELKKGFLSIKPRLIKPLPVSLKLQNSELT